MSLVGLGSAWVPWATTLAAVNVEVTPGRAAAFLAAMGAVGYAMGRAMGDDYHLLPLIGSFGNRRAQGSQLVVAAIEAIEKDEPIPDLADVLGAISSANDVVALFADDRIRRLVGALHTPATPTSGTTSRPASTTPPPRTPASAASSRPRPVRSVPSCRPPTTSS